MVKTMPYQLTVYHVTDKLDQIHKMLKSVRVKFTTTTQMKIVLITSCFRY
jgi:hypothetical protein